MTPFASIPLPLQLYMPLILLTCTLVPATVLLILVVRDRGWLDGLQRSWLNHRLRHLRMRRMLSLRGIDASRYVALTPLAILRKELDICGNCTHKHVCDCAYVDGPNAVPPAVYCPNVSALDRRWLRKIH